MRRGSLTRWLTTPVAGKAGIARADVLIAAVLSAVAALSASGLDGSNAGNANAGWAAAAAVLLMSSPVLLVRRRPVPVAAALALGAAVNWWLIGDLVRCGVGLLVVFYTAFVLGARCRIRSAAVGLGLLAVNIVCQAYSDPQLGPEVILYMVPVAVGFAAAGRLLADRNAVVAELRTSTEQLRRQREETARLAVATEKARIAGHLDGFLGERVDRISGVAAAGRASLTTSPDGARDAFAEISRTGREALTRMRDVVADLAEGSVDHGGTEPAPVLARLDRLLADGAEGAARLHVVGDPRLLPPGVELSAYRVVERLLEATDGDATAEEAPIEVIVAFEPHELQLTVTGAVARRGAARAALAAVSERAAVHGGSVHTSATDRRRTTVVTFPLVVSHV